MSDYLKHLENITPLNTIKRKVEYIKYNYEKYLPFTNADTVEVLELGSGLGEFVQYLNGRKVDKIDIIDNDENVLRYIAGKYHIRQTFCAQDAVSLDDRLGQYDAIVLTQVMEHFTDLTYVAFIKLLHKHLKAGGSIIITVPNGGNPLNTCERYYDITHYNAFTDNSLKEVVGFCELNDVEVFTNNFNIPPYTLINLIRIVLQKILHYLMIAVIIVNGGIFSKVMTPNVTLVIRKKT